MGWLHIDVNVAFDGSSCAQGAADAKSGNDSGESPMRATALVLWRTLGRRVQLTSAALLCATVLAGCSAGVAHEHESARHHESAPDAPVSASASATSRHARLAHPATTPVPPPVAGNIHQ